MICSLVEPHEAIGVFEAWGAWVILDFLVEQVVGKEKEAHVLAAVFGIAVISLFLKTCSSDEKKKKKKKNKYGTLAPSLPDGSIH